MTKKQQKVLWRIIATAVLVAVVKLFSIGRDGAVSGGLSHHRL